MKNPGIPGAESKSRYNPRKPGMVGRYALALTARHVQLNVTRDISSANMLMPDKQL